MSGITVAPRSRRITSASGVVGPLAPSATMEALTRSALPSWIWPPTAAGQAADAERLAGDHAGYALALGHRVRVHHPGHRLLIGAEVRGGNVQVRADHEDDLGGIASGEVLLLLHRELAGITPDAALGPAVGEAHQGALPGHQHRQSADLAQVHVRGVAEPPFGRSEHGVVVTPVPHEYFGLS